MHSVKLGFPFVRRGVERWSFSIIGAFVVLAVIAVIYRPVLDAGFWSDDYQLIGPAARWAWHDLLSYYLDPRVQWLWYRPVLGLGASAEYLFFGNNPAPYHAVQLLLHGANSLLLLVLVTHTTHRRRLGFLSALIYATWPVVNLAVYWISVSDPLLVFFALLCLWLWIRYVETGKRLYGVFAYASMFVAFGAKETGIVIPAILFLADRWLVRKQIGISELLKRYIPLLAVSAGYTMLLLQVSQQSGFTRNAGYGIGINVLRVGGDYLKLLVSPWQGISLPVFLAAILAGSLFVFFSLRRCWPGVFLFAAGALTLGPVLLFQGAIARYLYWPLMASAVVYAVFAEELVQVSSRFIPRPFLLNGLFATLFIIQVGMGGATISEGAVAFTGAVRQVNLKLRPVFQRHPIFGPDTLLYFWEMPYPSINLNGALALRYGANVSAIGTGDGSPLDLRKHAHSLVIFSDEGGAVREQTITAHTAVEPAPSLPARFEQDIYLDAFMLASEKIAPGESLILFLKWHAGTTVNKDYTVFAHLVTPDGETVAASDSQPLHGTQPTTRWIPQEGYWDSIQLPIGSAVPPGTQYHVEVGMYELATMHRLSLVPAEQHEGAGTVSFGPIEITH